MKKYKQTIKTVAITFFAILLLITPLHANGELLLQITVTTDKQEYNLGEAVYIEGSLKLDGTPVEDALVGIEVRDSADLPYIFRTRPTGTITTQDWPVNFTSLFPCDSNGNPKYIFEKNEFLWISFTVKNFDQWSSHDIIVCITLYDADGVPVGVWLPYSTTLDGGKSTTIYFMATQISDSMALGTATIYANIYSRLPRNGGYPYCPEKTATFTITSSTYASKLLKNPSSQAQNGNYNVSFKIASKDVRLGNYTVYVSSFYWSQLATGSTTFTVILMGDINGDKVVNFKDAIILGAAFGSEPEDPNWDYRADINGDKVVNFKDAIILGADFGKSGI